MPEPVLAVWVAMVVAVAQGTNVPDLQEAENDLGAVVLAPEVARGTADARY